MALKDKWVIGEQILIFKGFILFAFSQLSKKELETSYDRKEVLCIMLSISADTLFFMVFDKLRFRIIILGVLFKYLIDSAIVQKNSLALIFYILSIILVIFVYIDNLYFWILMLSQTLYFFLNIIEDKEYKSIDNNRVKGFSLILIGIIIKCFE